MQCNMFKKFRQNGRYNHELNITSFMFEFVFLFVCLFVCFFVEMKPPIISNDWKVYRDAAMISSPVKMKFFKINSFLYVILNNKLHTKLLACAFKQFISIFGEG